MTTIRLLENVADSLKGAVLVVDERRAQRLLRAGYAEAVVTDDVTPPKKKDRDRDGRSESRHRV